MIEELTSQLRIVERRQNEREAREREEENNRREAAQRQSVRDDVSDGLSAASFYADDISQASTVAEAQPRQAANRFIFHVPA